ncbi:MAG TPA: glycosyltransferase family 1 protein [Candidatus Binatia bacterium]|nr:glycosyltransferase family 1 protein [Candidatus Binatia bacterium]
MRVVVTGLVATYPVGGVAWDYLQYALGFHALGCDVFYLEDTGRWVYDPAAQTFTSDVSRGARYLADALGALAPPLGRAWAVRAADGRHHGADAAAVERRCAEADLFLNVSGACWLREPYQAARVKAYLDTDPCYSQAKLAAVDAGTADGDVRFSADLIRRHDVFFTLGEHVGAPDCAIPTGGLTWHPTRQPIALDCWPVDPPPAGAPFTTVMSWKIEPTPPVVGGRAYGGKDVEFERFLALPAHAEVPLEVALSGAAPRARLAAAGWRVVEGHAVSATPADYRRYILGSRGEWSVAKNAYVATRSGWFSTRSAAYLACGRPVVVQDTGWPAHVPPGPGVQPFATVEEAAAALAAVAAEYPRAREHARAVAVEHFDAKRVCARLLADAGL